MKRMLVSLAVLALALPLLMQAVSAREAACVTQQITGRVIQVTGARAAIVVLQNTSPATCVLSGYPLAASGGNPLPTAHASLRRTIRLAPGAQAAFKLAFHPSREPAPEGQACALNVLLSADADPVAPAIRIDPCTSVDRVAVTSYRSGVAPPDDVRGPLGLARGTCAANDLEARELPIVRGAGNEIHTIALMNRSTSVCRLNGHASLTLLDAANRAMLVPTVPNRAALAMQHTIAPGYEVSFTVQFAHLDDNACPPSARVRIAFPGSPGTVIAPLALAPCPVSDGGGGMSVSLLSDGIPIVL